MRKTRSKTEITPNATFRWYNLTKLRFGTEARLCFGVHTMHVMAVYLYWDSTNLLSCWYTYVIRLKEYAYMLPVLQTKRVICGTNIPLFVLELPRIMFRLCLLYFHLHHYSISSGYSVHTSTFVDLIYSQIR